MSIHAHSKAGNVLTIYLNYAVYYKSCSKKYAGNIRPIKILSHNYLSISVSILSKSVPAPVCVTVSLDINKLSDPKPFFVDKQAAIFILELVFNFNFNMLPTLCVCWPHNF